jgi:hypothetical protein
MEPLKRFSFIQVTSDTGLKPGENRKQMKSAGMRAEKA